MSSLFSLHATGRFKRWIQNGSVKIKEESLVFDDFVATKQQVIKKAEDETVLK